MTAILIPREPIPVALTSEQVVAYLLRTGWVEDGAVVPQASYRGFYGGDEWIGVPRVTDSDRGRRRLTEAILDIARAESRPAEQVAADIAGSAVGIVGAVCEALTGRARRDRNECMWAWLAEAPRAPVEE